MTELERAHFLAQRRKGLGASDMAAVLGLSPWKSALDIWADKLDVADPLPMTEPMRWGLLLEDVIADEFERRTKIEIAKPVEPYKDPDCPILVSNLDRETDAGEPVELKTSRSSKGWGPDGSDLAPEYYLIQIQCQMACTEANRGYIAVLIGGSDFRVYEIERSDLVIERIREEAKHFWENFVLTRQAPPEDWHHPRILETIKRLNTTEAGSVLEAQDPTHEFNGLAADYHFLSEALKAVEQRKERCQARMIAAAAGAETVLLAEGSKWTYKKQTRKSYVVKESTFSVARLTYKGPKADPLLAMHLPQGYESTTKFDEGDDE